MPCPPCLKGRLNLTHHRQTCQDCTPGDSTRAPRDAVLLSTGAFATGGALIGGLSWTYLYGVSAIGLVAALVCAGLLALFFGRATADWLHDEHTRRDLPYARHDRWARSDTTMSNREPRARASDAAARDRDDSI